jgi:hypothetical protein
VRTEDFTVITSLVDIYRFGESSFSIFREVFDERGNKLYKLFFYPEDEDSIFLRYIYKIHGFPSQKTLIFKRQYTTVCHIEEEINIAVFMAVRIYIVIFCVVRTRCPLGAHH